MLTPRENILQVLNHKPPEYPPVFSNAVSGQTPLEILERAPAELREDGKIWDGSGLDWFGVHWAAADDGSGGSTVDTRFAPVLDDICCWKEIVKFPELSSLDWEGIGERYAASLRPDTLRGMIIHSGLFERLNFLMGMSEALIALMEEPEACREFMESIADYKIELLGYLIRYCKVEIIEMHDDWGHQTSSFFSPEVFKEVIAPPTKRIVDFCKSNGVFYMHHSCGFVENLIPIMVDEIGIEAWSSCQTMNNIPGIIEEYGEKLAIRGGMDLPGLTALEKEPLKAEELLRKLIPEYTYKGNVMLHFRPRVTPNLHSLSLKLSTELGGKCFKAR